MADSWFVGMRATDDLVTNERPESWRDGIIRLFPNGTASLTALTKLMRSEKVSDTHFHWWDKTLTTQKAAVTAGQCYDDATLNTAYGNDGVAGSNVYFKVAEAASKMFRPGHTILMRDAGDYTVDCVGKCILVSQNGANSVIGVKLIEADDNGAANSHYLLNADTLLIIGNANPMGGTRPTAITQQPTEDGNYTQIFRTPLDLARTLIETKLRTASAYQEAKRDALEQHSIEMEKGFIWGVQYVGVGSNGKPEYYTDGILAKIKANGTSEDFSLDTAVAYAGKTWVEAGVDWIDEHLEEIFRHGSDQRLVFCGSGALLGIQKLVRELGVYNLTPQTTSFGLKVTEWVTPFGSIMLKTHPLLSYEATNRNSMILFEPANIIYRYVTDTQFQPDILYGKGGGTGKDGKEEEFLTECGLEYHQSLTGGYLNGVGLDNTQ